jgi:hypothetical protein
VNTLAKKKDVTGPVFSKDFENFILADPFLSAGKVEDTLVSSWDDISLNPIIESNVESFPSAPNKQGRVSMHLSVTIKFDFSKLKVASKGVKQGRFFKTEEKKTKELRIYFADTLKGYVSNYEKTAIQVNVENRGNTEVFTGYILRDDVRNQFYVSPVSFKSGSYFGTTLSTIGKINGANVSSPFSLSFQTMFTLDNPKADNFNRIILKDVSDPKPNKATKTPTKALSKSSDNSGLSAINNLIETQLSPRSPAVPATTTPVKATTPVKTVTATTTPHGGKSPRILVPVSGVTPRATSLERAEDIKKTLEELTY